MGCGLWGRTESDTTERLPFHFSLSCIGEGHGNPLQCSCLENPRDRGAWWAAVYRVAQSRTRLKRLSSSSSSARWCSSYKSIRISFFRQRSKISTRLFNADYSAQHCWAFLVAQMIKNLPAMRETQVQSLGQEDPLEKGMATHSSILAWRTPWTEEPGRLQYMGLQRVRRD